MSFPPVWSSESRILILGTYPSPLSRATGFYYGHPRNRFWPLIAKLLGEETPEGIEQKKELLLLNNIALWDVLDSCEIIGASDSSITSPVPNDLSELMAGSRIGIIFANGSKAAELYRRFMKDDWPVRFQKLPSTSPANARFDFGSLLEEWSCILQYLR